MNVVGILKDVENRLAVEMGLAMMGHSSVVCSALSDGMAAITSSTDVILADAFMDGLGPSGVGFLVASVLSESRPRLVLVARSDMLDSIGELPPERVMGVLSTPLSAAKLHKVIRFLEYASKRCPGTAVHGNSNRCLHESRIKSRPDLCHTREYGQCPRYRSICGMNVQRWIGSALVTEWRNYPLSESFGAAVNA